MYGTLAHNPQQRRLVDLEKIQAERRQHALLEAWTQAYDQAPARLQAALVVLWYWLSHEPAGPAEADLEATLRLLRGQTTPRRYRLLLHRAQAELDAAERGEPGPVFRDLWEWLGVDREPGHGRAGTGLTW
jgi:hypothetical protein